MLRAWILLAAIMAGPAAAGVEPDSSFGVVCPWGGLKEAGIRWVRCGAGATPLGDWPGTELGKNRFDWKSSDEDLEGDIRQELIPLPILGYTPAWASSDTTGSASAPPDDVLAYARFARTFMDRYRGRVTHVEIWNEPDIGFFTGTIGQYAELLKAGCTGAKMADPGCRVVFGGTAGVNLDFIEGVYAYGGGSYFDVMAVHPYQWGDEFNDEWFVSQLVSLRAIMNRHGDSHKPIWLTELGWSTGDRAITEDVQARLLVQAMVTALSLRPVGVEKAFWFCVKDWGGPGYGLLRDDGSRKPAYQAYSVLARMLGGARYVGSVDVGRDARCHVFRRASGPTVAVVWSRTKREVPVSLRCAGRAVSVVSMLGQRSEISPEVGELRLTAHPQPVYIAGIEIENTRPPDPHGYRVREERRTCTDGVWVSAKAPAGTSRPYAVAGQRTQVEIEVHNISDAAITGWLSLDAPGARRGPRVRFSVDPRSTSAVSLPLDLHAGAREGVHIAQVRGESGGRHIGTTLPLRIADGHVIEFLANSTVEGSYIHRNENSGGAPSIRFGGAWVYRFDLTSAKSARVALNVGAHEARHWRVLASLDDKSYQEVLSGSSNRSWHERDLSGFVPGEVFLRFEGDGQQLGELVLTWR